MAQQFSPLSSDLYSIPKAQILFKPQGSTAFELLGDSDEVTLEPTVEETERFSNEGGIRQLVKTVVTQVDAQLSMTLVQLSDRNRALSLLGEIEYDEQTVAAGHEMTLTAPLYGGKIYQLDHMDIDPESVIVTDTTMVPVPLVLGTHYKVDTQAGFIQLLVKPDTANANVKIEYDAPEIVEAEGRTKIGLANKTENRGHVIIRGTNEVGPNLMLNLWDVQLRPDGARNYISETDFDTMTIVGRVFRDDTRDAGYELGFERLLGTFAEVEPT